MTTIANTQTHVTVRLFGAEAQAAGQRAVAVVLNRATTCADLRRALAETIPALQPFLDHARFAVNHAFADESDLVELGDEVALIGRVSGG